MFNTVAPIGSIVIVGLFRKRYFRVESYGLVEVTVQELPKE